MSIFRYAARHMIVKLDRWAHYHRFQWRTVCDLHDFVNGTPWPVVRLSREAHAVARSYSTHPSQQSAAAEVLDG